MPEKAKRARNRGLARMRPLLRCERAAACGGERRG